jgi:hypothetical protein
MGGTDDGGHPAGDFAHGFQQWQTVVHLDGFVGDGGEAFG